MLFVRLREFLAFQNQPRSRRRFVRDGLLGLGFGALGIAAHVDETSAGRRSRRKKRNRRQQRRNNSNGGNGALDPGAGPGNPAGGNRLGATNCTVCASNCPYSTIQAAIDAAVAGSTIVICDGLYTEDITIGKNLTLAAVEGAEVEIEGTGTTSVVTVQSGATVTLQELEISEGTGTPTASGRFGGGILNGGTLTIGKLTIGRNSADRGGAIANSGHLTVSDTIIGANRAQLGAGIYNLTGGVLVLTAATQITRNVASSGGGGIYNEVGRVTINQSTIQMNTASTDGGGVFNRGTMILENGAVIDNNEAQNGGGAFNLGNVGAERPTLSVVNSAITNNEATALGGGVFNQDGVVTLKGGTILENTAKTLGGGIFTTDGGTVELDAESAVIDNKPDNCIGSDACPA